MNQGPPIASPFGEADLPQRRVGQPKPTWLLNVLAVLVWLAHLYFLLVSVRFSPQALTLIGPLFFVIMALSILLVSVIYLGLLRAWKTSWWLAQGKCVLDIFFGSHSSSVSLVQFRVLLWTVEVALFLYLLTPAMRQFFFSRPKPSDQPTNHPSN